MRRRSASCRAKAFQAAAVRFRKLRGKWGRETCRRHSSINSWVSSSPGGLSALRGNRGGRGPPGPDRTRRNPGGNSSSGPPQSTPRGEAAVQRPAAAWRRLPAGPGPPNCCRPGPVRCPSPGCALRRGWLPARPRWPGICRPRSICCTVPKAPCSVPSCRAAAQSHSTFRSPALPRGSRGSFSSLYRVHSPINRPAARHARGAGRWFHNYIIKHSFFARRARV